MSKKWLAYAEELAQNNRFYRRFYNAMKTDSTRSLYAYSMKRFMDFLVRNNKIQNDTEYDELVGFDSDKITDLLEDFVFELNNRVKPKAVTTMLAAPELFFEMNRKIWHKKLVRKSIRKDDVESGGKIPITDEELQSVIDSAIHPRDKALIHFLASTGSRPAGITDPILRMKHLTYMPNPSNPNQEQHWCYAVRIYDESKEGYWSFLTPEATAALDRYFGWRKHIRKEEFDDETPIFANFSKQAKNEFLGMFGIRQTVSKLLRKASVKRVKKGTRYDKAQNYMFRKRFNGKLKMENSVNSNIAEKLMAHKRGLDGTYLQPTRDECYREFVKAIPQLTVDPTQRLKLENEKKQEKIDQLEAKTREVVIETTKDNEDLKKRLYRVEKLLSQQNVPVWDELK